MYKHHFTSVMTSWQVACKTHLSRYEAFSSINIILEIIYHKSGRMVNSNAGRSRSELALLVYQKPNVLVMKRTHERDWSPLLLPLLHHWMPPETNWCSPTDYLAPAFSSKEQNCLRSRSVKSSSYSKNPSSSSISQALDGWLKHHSSKLIIELLNS